MKLVISILHSDIAESVGAAMSSAGFYATKLSTVGGYLKNGNVTFLTGVEDERVDELISLIRSNSETSFEIMNGGTADSFASFPIEVKAGGATIFVLPIERFEKF